MAAITRLLSANEVGELHRLNSTTAEIAHGERVLRPRLIRGTRAGLLFRSANSARQPESRLGPSAVDFVARSSEPLRSECDHFIDCVIHAKTPLTDGAEAARVVRVLDAIGRSAANAGREVRIES